MTEFERLVDIIAGARPNFMKIAPIVRAIRGGSRGVACRIVHTGQHYDRSMSGDFFEQLGIPSPDANLEVGSGTQAEQTAAVMVRYERLLLDRPPAICLVVGDVNSTMACAIASRKLGVPVAHVEGGLRSGDPSMPEEINRLVTDSISNWFFTTSRGANGNLRREGVGEDRLFLVGNTMIDTLLANLDRLRPPSFWDASGLEAGRYCVLTLHRPGNVDLAPRFLELLRGVAASAQPDRVVFPAHPRVARTLESLGPLPPNLLVVPPQPYLEFNHLVRHARVVVTDSGGVTEETTVLGVPCMTLRDSTERPETVEIGTNELVGTDPAAIPAAFHRLRSGGWKRGGIPEFWDGRAGERIAAHLASLLGT